MDAKDLSKEAALGDRNDDTASYTQSGAAVEPCSRPKTYQDMGSSPMAKAEVVVSRPCAVIGPDRVVPPADTYPRKPPEPWPADPYRRPPDYPLKLHDYQHPTRNISPRQTFQENMQRIMVPPTYATNKLKEDCFQLESNISPLRNKVNVSTETKFCDVPYAVNPIVNDPKNVRTSDVSVPNINSVLTRSAPQAWGPVGAQVRPTKTYSASELYQYPDFTSCAAPRPMYMTHPHRSTLEESGHLADPYGNVRFKPYPTPTMKDRYLQPRYDYISNYPNPVQAQPVPFSSHRTIPSNSNPGYSQVPLKYMDSRLSDPLMNSYQRPTNPQTTYNNLAYRNQVIHPSYGTIQGSCLQPNKFYPYPDTSPKAMAAKLPPYPDFEGNRPKPYPVPDGYYINDVTRSHSMKGQVMPPNYPTPNLHMMHPHSYYRKDSLAMKSFDHGGHYRNIDPSININANALPRFTSQFPNAVPISSDSMTQNTTNLTPQMFQEDFSYINQSPSVGTRGFDPAISRFSNDPFRRYEYNYGPVHKPPPVQSKCEPYPVSDQSSKDKKDLDVRKFLEMWNEEEESSENNTKNNSKPVPMNTVSPGTPVASNTGDNGNQEQLYVMGIVNVPREELDKYEHIQKVSKLPENIKGYNNIEILHKFEEVIESSNLNDHKSPPTSSRDFRMPPKNSATFQPITKNSVPYQPPPNNSVPYQPPPNNSVPYQLTPNNSVPYQPSPNNSVPYQPSPNNSVPYQPPPKNSVPYQPPPKNSVPFQPPPQNSVPFQTMQVALPRRPLSPLDVESKISQSVIHKEVGCNFEIKPCSPKMLNAERATPVQNIITERVIEKVSNRVGTPPSSNKITVDNPDVAIATNCQDSTISLMEQNIKSPCCKMAGTQYSKSDIDVITKPNYTLQDLESNSGVCLASLPRLDNDIELSFPEVNQQFINANKIDSVITPKPLQDLETPFKDVGEKLQDKQSQTQSKNDQQHPKLNKYRKMKRKSTDSIDKSCESSKQVIRTDSVIIKNPDTNKIFEGISAKSPKCKADVNTQRDPINLTKHTDYFASVEESMAALHNEISDDSAIDFSLHSNDRYQEYPHPNLFSIDNHNTSSEIQLTLESQSDIISNPKNDLGGELSSPKFNDESKSGKYYQNKETSTSFTRANIALANLKKSQSVKTFSYSQAEVLKETINYEMTENTKPDKGSMTLLKTLTEGYQDKSVVLPRTNVMVTGFYQADSNNQIDNTTSISDSEELPTTQEETKKVVGEEEMKEAVGEGEANEAAGEEEEIKKAAGEETSMQPFRCNKTNETLSQPTFDANKSMIIKMMDEHSSSDTVPTLTVNECRIENTTYSIEKSDLTECYETAYSQKADRDEMRHQRLLSDPIAIDKVRMLQHSPTIFFDSPLTPLNVTPEDSMNHDDVMESSDTESSVEKTKNDAPFTGNDAHFTEYDAHFAKNDTHFKSVSSFNKEMFSPWIRKLILREDEGFKTDEVLTEPDNISDCERENISDCESKNITDCESENITDCESENITDCETENISNCKPENVSYCVENVCPENNLGNISVPNGSKNCEMVNGSTSILNNSQREDTKSDLHIGTKLNINQLATVLENKSHDSVDLTKPCDSEFMTDKHVAENLCDPQSRLPEEIIDLSESEEVKKIPELSNSEQPEAIIDLSESGEPINITDLSESGEPENITDSSESGEPEKVTDLSESGEHEKITDLSESGEHEKITDLSDSGEHEKITDLSESGEHEKITDLGESGEHEKITDLSESGEHEKITDLSESGELEKITYSSESEQPEKISYFSESGEHEKITDLCESEQPEEITDLIESEQPEKITDLSKFEELENITNLCESGELENITNLSESGESEKITDLSEIEEPEMITDVSEIPESENITDLSESDQPNKITALCESEEINDLSKSDNFKIAVEQSCSTTVELLAHNGDNKHIGVNLTNVAESLSKSEEFTDLTVSDNFNKISVEQSHSTTMELPNQYKENKHIGAILTPDYDNSDITQTSQTSFLDEVSNDNVLGKFETPPNTADESKCMNVNIHYECEMICRKNRIHKDKAIDGQNPRINNVIKTLHYDDLAPTDSDKKTYLGECINDDVVNKLTPQDTSEESSMDEYVSDDDGNISDRETVMENQDVSDNDEETTVHTFNDEQDDESKNNNEQDVNSEGRMSERKINDEHEFNEERRIDESKIYDEQEINEEKAIDEEDIVYKTDEVLSIKKQELNKEKVLDEENIVCENSNDEAPIKGESKNFNEEMKFVDITTDEARGVDECKFEEKHAEHKNIEVVSNQPIYIPLLCTALSLDTGKIRLEVKTEDEETDEDKEEKCFITNESIDKNVIIPEIVTIDLKDVKNMVGQEKMTDNCRETKCYTSKIVDDCAIISGPICSMSNLSQKCMSPSQPSAFELNLEVPNTITIAPKNCLDAIKNLYGSDSEDSSSENEVERLKHYYPSESESEPESNESNWQVINTTCFKEDLGMLHLKKTVASLPENEYEMGSTSQVIEYSDVDSSDEEYTDEEHTDKEHIDEEHIDETFNSDLAWVLGTQTECTEGKSSPFADREDILTMRNPEKDEMSQNFLDFKNDSSKDSTYLDVSTKEYENSAFTREILTMRNPEKDEVFFQNVVESQDDSSKVLSVVDLVGFKQVDDNITSFTRDMEALTMKNPEKDEIFHNSVDSKNDGNNVLCKDLDVSKKGDGNSANLTCDIEVSTMRNSEKDEILQINVDSKIDSSKVVSVDLDVSEKVENSAGFTRDVEVRNPEKDEMFQNIIDPKNSNSTTRGIEVHSIRNPDEGEMFQNVVDPENSNSNVLSNDLDVSLTSDIEAVEGSNKISDDYHHIDFTIDSTTVETCDGSAVDNDYQNEQVYLDTTNIELIEEPDDICVIDQSASVPKKPLKRSLSDSDLSNFKDDQDIIWPRKRARHNLNNKLYQKLSNTCNRIQNSRRNSLSSISNETHVSFCILIDNDCLIPTDCSDSDKIQCITEIAEDCITCVQGDPIVGGIDSSAEIVSFVEEMNEYSNNFSTEDVTEESHTDDSWVHDVACVETVVSDDIAEDIVISASPTSDLSNSEYENDDSDVLNTNDHTEKVKFIYGDKMCNNDVHLLETLYRTPQMNVNEKLVNKESQNTECNRLYDRDVLENVLSEPSGYPEVVYEPESVAFNTSSLYSPELDVLGNDKENMDLVTFNSPVSPFNVKDANAPDELAQTKVSDDDHDKTQDHTVHSCEASTDNVLSYDQNGGTQNCIISSSPEVSSTTSEEKNSSILMKITNLRVSHAPAESHNRISCKYTETNDYLRTDVKVPARPLITKAAQKYIPPLKETIPNLKVKLTLPEQSLLRLKHMKMSKESHTLSIKVENKPDVLNIENRPNVVNIEKRPNVVNNLRKDIPKKVKPKFEDVLKSIEDIQFQMHKEKSKKTKKSIPRVVIKKNGNGSHYASTSNETPAPDLTGRKWQPWVFLEKSHFIDKMARTGHTRAIFNHRKNRFILADNFKKYKSVTNSKFVISKPKIENSSSGRLKYTIRLKHSY